MPRIPMSTEHQTDAPVSAGASSTRPFTWSIAIFVAVNLGFVIATRGIDPTLPWVDTLKMCANWGFVVWGVWVFRATFRDGWRSTRARPWFTVGIVLAGVVASIAGAVLLQSIAVAIGTNSGGGQNQQNIEQLISTMPAFLTVPLIGLAGPIVEELIFRETPLSRLNGWIPTALGIVASSLIFGALHLRSLEEWPLLFDYAGSGLIFALLFLLARRNIYVPLAVHAIWNTTGAVLIVTLNR